MNILVINGSPAGASSITLQTVLYLESQFPECSFHILHAGQQIRKMEKDFAPCAKALEEADLLLFCYPVYTFLVPAQLHRFIELIKEHGLLLQGKYATQLTTSKHFYDTTAHQFIEENCRDLGLSCIRGLSADMEDLLQEKGQEEALAFFRFVLWNMQQRGCSGASFPAPERSEHRVAVVTDLSDDSDHALQNLIAQFQDATLSYALQTDFQMPKNFYGVGGLKIFRDLIYQMQGLMKADHKFYKEHVFYDDFPQKHRLRIAAMYLVGGMMRSKSLSRKMGGKMTEGMLMPY